MNGADTQQPGAPSVVSDEQRARLRRALAADSRARVFPLSTAQRRLWFLDRLVPGNAFYNVPLAARVRGRLDRAALRAALGDIVSRHEVLRTRLTLLANEPVQSISSECAVPVVELDLRGAAGTVGDDALLRTAQQLLREPFDLSSGPVIRGAILQVAEDDQLLMLVLHHVCTDGWSLRLLAQELSEAYAARAAGQVPQLPLPPLQYRQYAALERRSLETPEMQAGVDYWRQQLDGLESFELPTDRARTQPPTYRGATAPIKLGARTAALLTELCGEHQVTPFMMLLSVLSIILRRYTGRAEVAIASPVANREGPGREALMGFLVNSLVLRARVEKRQAFAELLEQVRATTLAAFAHQNVPFELLCERLRPERDLTRNPFCQIVFAVQQAGGSDLGLPGLECRPVSLVGTSTRFDLELHIARTREGFEGIAIYAADLFEASTIERLIRDFETACERVASGTSVSVGDLLRLNAREREAVLALGRGRPASPSSPVPTQIEQIVERHPQRPALVWQGTSMSYAGLWLESERRARVLLEHGVGAGDVVALCLPPGPAFVACALSAMRVGAAYLPISSNVPEARVLELLADARAAAIVTERRLVPPGGRCRCIPNDISSAQAVPLGSMRRAEASDLAYLIYTSGSTGRPNAVGVQHGALSNLVAWHQRAFGVSHRDRMSQIASLSFDAAVWEIWPTLCAGAALYFPDADLRLDPERLPHWLSAEAISICFLPTPLAERAWAEPWPSGSSLRIMLVGGERLSAPPPPGLPFETVNNYGPTEAAVVATFGAIAAERRSEGRPEAPDIGKPIDGAQIRIVDEDLELVAPGCPGELCIAGEGVALGYLGRPALTAERFVPDAGWRGESPPPRGARMYRTRDAGRFRPDGTVEFLGRLDDQIKLRGHRIEPGEVEAALRAQHAVADACVLVAGQADAATLVAHVVLAPAARAAATESDQGSLVEARVERWRQLYDQTYRESPRGEAPTFNIAGWRSSFTGDAIPEDEMREWRAATVARILAQRPREVLEIGCGTGLLLFELAGHCRRYRATDFSAQSIEYVRSGLARLPGLEVVLEQREACDGEGLPAGGFDTVIVNSVIQYFPNRSYLDRVLDIALRSLRPGGVLFVGDVRDLRHHEAQHTSVELFRASAEHTVAELALRARRERHEDRELLVAPDLFVQAAARSGRRVIVDTRLKRGASDNEMLRFRYDVLLHVDPAPGREEGVVRWRFEDLDGVDGLLHELEQQRPTRVVVEGVLNRRVASAHALVRALSSEAPATPAISLRSRLEATDAAALDPEQLAAQIEAAGHGVELLASADSERFDLAIRLGAPAAAECWPMRAAAEVRAAKGIVNDPLAPDLAEEQITRLRAELARILPEALVPGRFIVTDALPRLPSGKVDRAALRRVSMGGARGRAASESAPRTEIERALVAIWATLLELDSVGIDDDFFALGGHSLLATQLMSRINEQLGVELPLARLFEERTIAGLARVIAGEGALGYSIVAAPRTGVPPLSFAQQRLWFLDQLTPDNPFYNVPGALRLRGELKAEPLQRTFNEIVRRHEALRTRFPAEDGKPVQIVEPHRDVAIAWVDLEGLPESQREETALRLVNEESRRPFDLASGPLIRVRVLRLSPVEHVLIICLHHIISDGWSIGVLVRELAALYGAFACAGPSPLPELTFQYQDFTRWQRIWFTGNVREEQLRFWRQQLEGVPELKLPLDFARPAVPKFNGRSLSHRVGAELSLAVERLANDCKVTPFMLLLAAFDVLLFRLTGATDLAVGTPVANRNRIEVEGLIGFFVNSLVIRTRLEGNPRLVQIVERVRDAALRAYAHQDMPFEMIVEDMAPERDPRRNPIFQVAFALQNAPMAPLELAGLQLEPIAQELGTTRFDLEFHVWQRDAGIELVSVFDVDLFEERTIRGIQAHYTALLGAFVADPQQRLLDLVVPMDAMAQPESSFLGDADESFTL